MRLGLLASGAFLAASFLGTGVQAHAAVYDCVQYRVSGPVVGTLSGTPCSPVPSLYGNSFTYYHCDWAPPIGYSDCVSVTVHTP
jgi:hypothetical protein